MQLKNYPTAPLSRRLLAMAYDGLVLIAMYIIFGGVLVTVVSKALGYEEFVRLTPAQAASLFYIICFLYYKSATLCRGRCVAVYQTASRNNPVPESTVKTTRCRFAECSG